MNTFLKSMAFAGILSTSPSPAVENQVGIDVIDAKTQVSKIIDTQHPSIQVQPKEWEYFSGIYQLVEEYELDEDQKFLLLAFLSEKKVQTEITQLLKNKQNDQHKEVLLRSLFLGILFGGLFHHLKRRHLSKDISSTVTVTFLSAAGMYGFSYLSPSIFTWSEVFLIGSFLFRFYLENKNMYFPVKKTDIFEVDLVEEKSALLKPFEVFVEPVVAYDKNGKPLLWNKAMELETGYSFEEVLDYYNKNGDVMDLLYKGENREKVRKYLESLKYSQRGYKNITFTMTTKYGEEKTFSWSLLLDEDGLNLRFARHLEDLEEIRKKLYETEQKLLRDKLTGAFNLEALTEDYSKIINHPRRKVNYVKVMFDIDNFKSINDKFGHKMGNTILTQLVQFIKTKIRETDKIYRLHGDEFVILFESENMGEILTKIQNIKQEFSSFAETIDGFHRPVGTSWGMMDIPPMSPKSQEKIILCDMLCQVDRYMYAVKYFRLISEELTQRGVIGPLSEEKNGIGCPRLSSNNEFIGIDVMGNNYHFLLTPEDLELIHQRKQQLDDNNMRTGEN